MNEESPPAILTPAGIWLGIRENLFIGLSILPFGLAFGAAAAAAKIPAADAVVMSLLVGAGAAQFAVLSLWTAPLPIITIVATALIVNARHVVLGAALQPYLRGLSRWKVCLVAYFMSDTAWAYTLPRMANGGRDAGILLGSAFTQVSMWVVGTYLGASLAGGGLDGHVWGLDMMMVGLFTTTLLGLWRGRDDVLPWVAAILATLAALTWLPGNWYILAGGVGAGLASLMRPEQEARS